MLAYIRAHWHGELNLTQSFWVNVFALNLVMRGIESWFSSATPVGNPQIAARIILLYLLVTLCVIFPWQIVGLWRSATLHAVYQQKRFWPVVVKIVVVLGVLGTVGRIDREMPIYKDLYTFGFTRDEFSDYQVSLLDGGELIQVKGGLGFGVSGEVTKLLENNPEVTGIVLDSNGGRIYEGRELSKIILQHQFNTYSLTGCYSACGTAFISGEKRYLAQGANLGFHRYTNTMSSLDPYIDMKTEQEKDLVIYKRKGISQSFIDRLFAAGSDDLWYPTIDEMLEAGVIHGVVAPSDLKPIEYAVSSKNKIKEGLNSFEVYRVISKYDPVLYNKFIDRLYEQAKAGGSKIEIQQMGEQIIQSAAFRALPSASDQVVILFTRETVKILDVLEKKDPILCLKNLYPDEYGALEISRYISSDELRPMLDSLGAVLKDSYTTRQPAIDAQSGAAVLALAAQQLGDDSKYIGELQLNNRNDYSKACRAVIGFYQNILARDSKDAANALRYAYSF